MIRPEQRRSLCNVDTVLNPVECTQASSSAAVQTQPHVHSAQELIPMHLLVNDTGYPHSSSGVEQAANVARLYGGAQC
jgi:hypothetical protein